MRAEFFGDNVELNEDFAVRYSLDAAASRHTARDRGTRAAPAEPGFFQAQALLRIAG